MIRIGIEDDPAFRDLERSGWRRAAQAYMSSFEAVTALFAPALLDAVDVRAGMKVLDVACGAGLVCGLASARRAQVVGVDFSPEMLAEARQRHPAIDFRDGDAEALPFDNAGFEAVTINFGLNHFAFPARAVSEAHRVLRHEGRLALTTWASAREHVLYRILTDAVRAAGDASANLPMPPGGAMNEPDLCRGLLREAGFRPESLRAEDFKADVAVESASRLLALIEAGTVRMAAMLRAQPEVKRAAIASAVEEGIAPYRTSEGYRIPFAAILVAGTR